MKSEIFYLVSLEEPVSGMALAKVTESSRKKSKCRRLREWLTLSL